MLTAKCGAWRKFERFGERSDRLHSMRGGERETELNELHVRPTRAPSVPTVVTIVTPVGKVPSALRKALGSNGSLDSPDVLAITGSAGRARSRACICRLSLPRRPTRGRNGLALRARRGMRAVWVCPRTGTLRRLLRTGDRPRGCKGARHRRRHAAAGFSLPRSARALRAPRPSPARSW